MNVMTRLQKKDLPRGKPGRKTVAPSPVLPGGSQLLFSSIARHFPDGIIGVLDTDFRYVFAGGAELDRLGLQPELLKGQLLFDHLSDKSNKDARPYLEQAFRGATTQFEVELNKQIYAVNAVPLNEAGEAITQVLVVLHNITLRRKNEKDLQEALRKEKELSELKSRFVTMASHEFRTPLSTILSSAYLIGKYVTAEDQPKREKHLQRIVSSVTMLTDILNDFLSVGKIEEGRIQVRLAEFSIRQLTEQLCAEMEGTLKKGQAIRYRHKGPEDVCLDPSLLRHIIMNLVSNASKFSGEGSPIDMETRCKKGEVIFRIQDYGIGIPKEDQQHLLERFFRGGNVANIQGTGLGLHIVARYAELLNGEISCESELEKGTTFSITFRYKMNNDEKDTADRRQ